MNDHIPFGAQSDTKPIDGGLIKSNLKRLKIFDG